MITLASLNGESAGHSHRKIHDYARTYNLVPRVFQYLGKKLLVLEQSADEPLESRRATGYIEQHIVAAEDGIFNNCFDIARLAVRAGRARGALHTHDVGTQDFIGYVNHGLNYDILADGTTLAVDLTASANVDRHRGLLDVLAIRATDLDELRGRVGELYGGNWELTHPIEA